MCRERFDELEVEPLPGMNIKTLENDRSDDIKKENDDKESSGLLCSEHFLSFLFWCNECKMFFCKKCLKKDHRLCDYDLIEDSIVNIKGAIHDKVCLVNEKIRLGDIMAYLTTTRFHLIKSIKLLEKELKCVNKNIDKLIEIEITRKEYYKEHEVKQIGDKLDSEDDVNDMKKWYNTLSKMDSLQELIEITERNNNSLHLLLACIMVSNFLLKR